MRRGGGGMRFTITTHPGIDGARLSLAGQWGNIPYPTIADAESAAQAEARGRSHTIEHHAVRANRRRG